MVVRRIFSMVIVPAVSTAVAGLLKLSMEERRVGPAQRAGERIDQFLARTRRHWGGRASHLKRRFEAMGIKALRPAR